MSAITSESGGCSMAKNLQLFKEGHERPLAKFTKRGATLEIVKSVEHIQELCIIFVTVYFMGLLVPEYCTEQGHCHCDITDDRPTHEHTQNARLWALFFVSGYISSGSMDNLHVCVLKQSLDKVRKVL